MPCSRIEAPLAQCAPRLSGESNTGSWRTHTPFCTTASIAHPTEQCVHTVRFTSMPALSSAASALPIILNGKADAADDKAGIEVKRTVCTHCSVGCAIDAVVQNGVWVRQEPVFDSPLNLGAHCAKGAAIREHGMTEHSHRLKYPMKLVDGKYQRISWDTAINEIGDKTLALRKESGPD